MCKENDKPRDSVFTDLFQKCPEAVENALSLFNALNDTDYNDPSKLKHVIIKDTLYRNLKNDVSFQYEDKLVVLIEHQSTINYNMPLRSLMYIGRLYEKLVPIKMRYKRNLVMLPLPEIYVLYNGKENSENEYTLKLSDAFNGISPIELIVKVINIRADKKHPILNKCKVLDDYSRFIATIERYKDSQIEDPYKYAIRECIEKGILKEYLLREGSEVVNMLTAEYDYDTDIEAQREEAFSEGINEGETRMNILISKLSEAGRLDELTASANNPALQKQLLEEFGLI